MRYMFIILFPLSKRAWMQYIYWMEEHHQGQYHLSYCGDTCVLLEDCPLVLKLCSNVDNVNTY